MVAGQASQEERCNPGIRRIDPSAFPPSIPSPIDPARPSRAEHYYGAATGEPWTLGAQTSVNSSILLSQKIDEMGRGNASLSTIDPFLLSNKLLFILHLELQKQCVRLTRRIFNTINNFSYTAYLRMLKTSWDWAGPSSAQTGTGTELTRFKICFIKMINKYYWLLWLPLTSTHH